MHYLGLGKTLFNSGACLIKSSERMLDIELLLTERLTRKKASGLWPEVPLKNLLQSESLDECKIAENRDVVNSETIEKYLNDQYPFFEHLKKEKLEKYSPYFNKNILWVSHHLCHAYAALAMSPFEKSLIIVMDGAGSNYNDLVESQGEKHLSPINWKSEVRYLEEHSVYTQNNGTIRCVKKNWQTFNQPENSMRWYSQGLGMLYEQMAEYIFNEKTAAGKVMGLAAFGRSSARSSEIANRFDFLVNLDWSQSFSGKGKALWESSLNLSLYSDLAACVQNHFEDSLINIVKNLKTKYPDYENLILVGGCALNCTTNMKIFNQNIFKNIYVPPFPGDESISLGAASYLYHHDHANQWSRRDHEFQHGYFGDKKSIPIEKEIFKIFEGFSIRREDNISSYAAQLISQNKIIGWYQGRSETGPRALGNRSILARVDYFGVKNKLNEKIKMRENFRPYGCSVLHEQAHILFDVPAGFNNPFMSFAVPVQPAFSQLLAEVTHFDGTSRMQTVRHQVNPLFHALIREVGALTNIPCVLNTSLNVMGEPIVENLEDAKNFLLKTPVDGLVIGNFYIERPEGL